MLRYQRTPNNVEIEWGESEELLEILSVFPNMIHFFEMEGASFTYEPWTYATCSQDSIQHRIETILQELPKGWASISYSSDDDGFNFHPEVGHNQPIKEWELFTLFCLWRTRMELDSVVFGEFVRDFAPAPEIEPDLLQKVANVIPFPTLRSSR